MRPSLLNPLFTSIKTLAGVNTKICSLFAKVLNINLVQREPTLIDLLRLMPHSVIDRRKQPNISFAQEGDIVTLEIIIDQHIPQTNHSRVPYRVIGYDQTGTINLIFFHAQRSWLEKQLPKGKKVIVSGKVERFKGQLSMIHPDHILFYEQLDQMPFIEPIYPSTAGLSTKTLRRATKKALDSIPSLPEWIEESIKKEHNFSSFSISLRRIHDPINPDDLTLESTARKRLAYDEFFANQIALGLVRLENKSLS
ncbi:MAG: OB-fold nucleic acid binding domain-containing protein, partial [Bartonella sp.]|nr:OB-fold nucleic acid binding domain-containing protein [Bartonella sp.]